MSRHDRCLWNTRGVRSHNWYCWLIGTLLLAPHLLAQNTITTLAGTEYVFSGDGKSGLAAPLGLVASVALDLNGNPVFTDPQNNIVIRLNSIGLVTVLAGNGLQGYSGDGGPATSAALNTPQGLAFDTSGNLYIVDSGNSRIRMVTPGGAISTVAGNGLALYAGDGIPALSASLANPVAIAVDSSNIIYFSDLDPTTSGTRIRRITTDGIISTVAGNGQAVPSPDGVSAKTASLLDVEDLVADSKGNLYLAEFGNNRIRKIDVNGILTTVAGDGRATFAGDGGPATKASLNSPGGVTVDSSNNIYISDTGNSCIRKVNTQGNISTIAGVAGVLGFYGDGGSALNAHFNGVFGLAVDSAGNIVATDTDNERVRKVESNGTIKTLAGNGLYRFFADGTLAANAFLDGPEGVSVDGSGNIYIADTGDNAVRKITKAGVISTFAGNGAVEYAGDGGAATEAALAHPANATQAGSSLYIADTSNYVIRKVTGDGTINTVAGNGNQGYSGDGGPATKATLNLPQDVIWDSFGNLYISDSGNNVIRRVSTDGNISTVVGNGQQKYSGDGGSALQASLSEPRGLAIDSVGNLYIVDAGNLRIRRVSTNGIISTIAGGGGTVVSTTSIPATQAFLGSPQAIVIDQAGNVYFSDGYRNRVYEVSATTGNIFVVAGNGKFGFTGDGGPATLAELNGPSGLALDAQGNLLIADSGNNRIRAILVTPPTLNSSPASLSFSAKSAGGLTTAQSINIGSTVSGLLYTLTPQTSSGGSWLKIVNPQSGPTFSSTASSASSGTIPATVQIQADPTGLDPGTYQGSIVISAPNANPSSQAVAVTFTVSNADLPKLGVGYTFLTYSFVQGASPSSHSLSVSNLGGGALSFSATVSTDTGGNWLSVSPSSGSATPVLPASLTVQADPTGLDPGTYTGTVTIAGGAAGTVAVPVTITVSGIPRKLLLSQTGLKYTTVLNGGTPLTQSFAVINSGQGNLNWTVQGNTLPAGGAWLTVTPPNDVSPAGSPLPPVVTVAVDASSLTPGEYYGLIQVFSGDADNSPQNVTVVLDVQSAGSDPGPEVRPTGLVFTGPTGSSPGSQNVMISDLTSTAIDYSSQRVTQDGQNWFVNAPTNDTVAPNQPAEVVVQPDFTHLSPGVYNGVLTLFFNGGVTRTVNILSIVTDSSSQGTSSEHTGEVTLAMTGVHDSGSCSLPKGLYLSFTSPDPNTKPVATQPVKVQISVKDNCGVPMQSGGVTLAFSNGDPSHSMQQSSIGVWETTWQPRSAVPAQVTMTATALETETLLGQNNLTVTLQPGGTTPVVSSGVLNSASLKPNPLIAPGELVTVIGQGLSDGCTNSLDPPLTTQAAGTQVFFDNTLLALSYACTDVSHDQINAQVPYGLAVNSPHQLIVQRDQALSIPVDVSVASAQPAIFTVSANGIGPAYIFPVLPDGSQGDTPISSSTPARAGDLVLIECAGLGLVAPAVGLGQATPNSPVAQTLNAVLVSIGGQSAQVLGASLLPSRVGVYGVEVVVPAGLAPGDQPVILTVAGLSSPNTATMAVAVH